MSYILNHTTLGFCWWDLPALIVLIAVIVYFVVRSSKMKRTQQELEDRVSELYEKDIQTSETTNTVQS